MHQHLLYFFHTHIHTWHTHLSWVFEYIIGILIAKLAGYRLGIYSGKPLHLASGRIHLQRNWPNELTDNSAIGDTFIWRQLKSRVSCIFAVFKKQCVSQTIERHQFVPLLIPQMNQWRNRPSCTEPWPQPHRTPFGWTGTPIAGQVLMAQHQCLSFGQWLRANLCSWVPKMCWKPF